MIGKQIKNWGGTAVAIVCIFFILIGFGYLAYLGLTVLHLSLIISILTPVLSFLILRKYSSYDQRNKYSSLMFLILLLSGLTGYFVYKTYDKEGAYFANIFIAGKIEASEKLEQGNSDNGEDDYYKTTYSLHPDNDKNKSLAEILSFVPLLIAGLNVFLCYQFMRRIDEKY